MIGVRALSMIFGAQLLLLAHGVRVNDQAQLLTETEAYLHDQANLSTETEVSMHDEANLSTETEVEDSPVKITGWLVGQVAQNDRERHCYCFKIDKENEQNCNQKGFVAGDFTDKYNTWLCCYPNTRSPLNKVSSAFRTYWAKAEKSQSTIAFGHKWESIDWCDSFAGGQDDK